MMEKLLIGEIPYLDCYPYFYPLKKNYQQSFFQFVQGHPADLNAMLRRGQLDVSISSSIEYCLNFDQYLVLPELGISSSGPVGSVLLFSDLPLEDLDEMAISTTSASATGVFLLKVILGKYLQFTNQFKTSWNDTEAHLLIGDSALREKILERYQYCYDLGELWYDYTGLPMVFALWQVRREASQGKREQIITFHRSLKSALEIVRKNWQELSQNMSGYDWIPQEMVIEYWKGIDYSLTSNHIKGLMKFYEDALELNLVEEIPEEIEFMEMPI